MNWIAEVDELHDFFAAWFSGTEASMERLESVLHADFTAVGPDGVERDRGGIIEAVRGRRDKDPALAITTYDHVLHHDDGAVVTAGYVERHENDGDITERLSTVVFLRNSTAVNGVVWLRVHETWRPS